MMDNVEMAELKEYIGMIVKAESQAILMKIQDIHIELLKHDGSETAHPLIPRGHSAAELQLLVNASTKSEITPDERRKLARLWDERNRLYGALLLAVILVPILSVGLDRVLPVGFP